MVEDMLEIEVERGRLVEVCKGVMGRGEDWSTGSGMRDDIHGSEPTEEERKERWLVWTR